MDSVICAQIVILHSKLIQLEHIQNMVDRIQSSMIDSVIINLEGLVRFI